jgi:hypothetical protein
MQAESSTVHSSEATGGGSCDSRLREYCRESLGACVDRNPLASILATFGGGLAVGVAVGFALGDTWQRQQPPPSRWVRLGHGARDVLAAWPFLNWAKKQGQVAVRTRQFPLLPLADCG